MFGIARTPRRRSKRSTGAHRRRRQPLGRQYRTGDDRRTRICGPPITTSTPRAAPGHALVRARWQPPAGAVDGEAALQKRPAGPAAGAHAPATVGSAAPASMAAVASTSAGMTAISCVAQKLAADDGPQRSSWPSLRQPASSFWRRASGARPASTRAPSHSTGIAYGRLVAAGGCSRGGGEAPGVARVGDLQRPLAFEVSVLGRGFLCCRPSGPRSDAGAELASAPDHRPSPAASTALSTVTRRCLASLAASSAWCARPAAPGGWVWRLPAIAQSGVVCPARSPSASTTSAGPVGSTISMPQPPTCAASWPAVSMRRDLLSPAKGYGTQHRHCAARRRWREWRTAGSSRAATGRNRAASGEVPAPLLVDAAAG